MPGNGGPSYQQRYELLFESCPVAVWIEDFSLVAEWFASLRSKGIRDIRAYLKSHPSEQSEALSKIRILDVNPEAIRQNGARNKEQLLGRLKELFTKETQDVLTEELALLYEGHRVVDLEIPTRRLDGGKAYMVMRIQVPGSPDKPDWTSVIVTGTDISIRREMEQKLRISMQEARSANEAKSRFLAHMSHEIRTPMNGILGMADLLLETPLQPEQTELARTLQSSCRSLLGILNDILDISKIEANRLQIENHPLRIRELIADVSDLLATGARERSLKFTAVVEQDMPHWIDADETRLRQVIFNLTGNAIKFTHSGSIKVCVARAGDSQFQIEVSDTGIGIDAGILSNLFRPFEQADASTTRRYGGTGLGLSIVRELVRLMDGHIEVSSNPGRGSVFRILLPMHELRDQEPMPPKRLPPDFSFYVNVSDSEERASLEKFFLSFGIPFSDSPPVAPPRPGAILLCDFTESSPGSPHSPENAHPGWKRIAVLPPGVNVRHDIVESRGFSGVLPLPLRHARFLQLLDEAVLSTLPSPTSPNRDAAPKDPDSPLHVLVAEDNPNNQMVIRLSLRKLGVDAVMVEDGVEAVEAVRMANGSDHNSARPFDLVILDFQMPRMDGLEAAKAILELPLHTRPYLAALTANAFPEDRRRALKIGFQSYLTKPLIPGQLKDLLATASAHRH